MAMIETREALDNLDGILGVTGLDAVFVGPSDLGQSLGYGPGMDREEPEDVEAIDTVLAAARDRDLAAGIFTAIHRVRSAHGRERIPLRQLRVRCPPRHPQQTQ